jgi:hypothetical protein
MHFLLKATWAEDKNQGSSRWIFRGKLKYTRKIEKLCGIR